MPFFALRRPIRHSVLLAAGLIVSPLLPSLPFIALSGPAMAEQVQQEPSIVTTDTASYCLQLADQLSAHSDATHHMRALTTEGRAMCAEGHIRAGIYRVRRAWVLLHQSEGRKP